MSATEVRLDEPAILDYEINGRTVWVLTESYEMFLRVPKTTKATFWKYGERGVIRSGMISVSGPLDRLMTLWDALRS